MNLLSSLCHRDSADNERNRKYFMKPDPQDYSKNTRTSGYLEAKYEEMRVA